MKVLKIMTLIIALFMISSCGKDDEKPEQQPEKTNMEKIVGKKWNKISETFDGADNIPNRRACTADDLLIFNSDGRFINDEGPTKCNADDNQTFGGGAFSIRDNLLTQEFDDEQFVFTIAKLDDKTMQLIINVDDGTLIRNYVAK